MIIDIWENTNDYFVGRQPKLRSICPKRVRILSDGKFIIKPHEDGIDISVDDRMEIVPVSSNRVIIRDTNYDD